MSQFKCDPQTRIELDQSPNKLVDAQVIQAALGASGRRIICKKDANGSAADPWATGTVFRDINSNGTMKVVAGKIVSLGRIKGTNISLPADTSTGSSVMRVQNSNGSRWIQVSIGPNGDVVANAPFTATNGFSVKVDFAISGKRLKPSGTGPAAPTLTPSAPNLFEVWNWGNPNSPTLVGTVTLNNRIDDFVYEDAEMAAENGDVAVYQSTQSVMYGNHEFGFTMLASHKGNTEANVEPLYQVIGSLAHRGTWTTYPFRDSYDQSQHVLYPDPFKVVMKNAAGNVLHTFEMHDGLAINDPSLAQFWDATHALRPNFSCWMQLPWENTRPKMSAKANKRYPGIHPYYQRPSMAKTQTTFNGVESMITGSYDGNSRNGIHNIYHCLQWPQPQQHQNPLPRDPYGVTDTEFNRSGASAEFSAYVDGYGYEPGSFTTHNWRTGPGGPRPDRAGIPSVVALYATFPNGNRAQGNLPYRDQLDGFLFGYFNQSNKWMTNPKTMQLVNTTAVANGDYSVAGQYYGDYPMPATNQIYTDGYKRDEDGAAHRDKTGRFICSGWARDPLHSYANAGHGALLLNSPMMGVASKFDTLNQWMLHGRPDVEAGHDGYLVRIQAWDWLHLTLAWKCASNHPLGITRADIEARWVKKLERIWYDVYKPCMIDNDQSYFMRGLRTFGTPVVDGDWKWNSPGGGLAFYMTHVLMLMKQTGLWAALQAKGGKVKEAMDFQIRNMDQWAFGRLVYTKFSRNSMNTAADGTKNEDGGYFGFPKNDPFPASWAAWSASYESPLSDYNHDDDGNLRWGDRDVSDHCFMAYPYMRRDFFPEIPHPLMQQACDKLTQYQEEKATLVAGGTSPSDMRNRDFTYGYAGVAPIKAPVELGPA